MARRRAAGTKGRSQTRRPTKLKLATSASPRPSLRPRHHTGVVRRIAEVLAADGGRSKTRAEIITGAGLSPRQTDNGLRNILTRRMLVVGVVGKRNVYGLVAGIEPAHFHGLGVQR